MSTMSQSLINQGYIPIEGMFDEDEDAEEMSQSLINQGYIPIKMETIKSNFLGISRNPL